MDQFKTIFLGFLATFISAWIGLVILPVFHYGNEAKAVVVPKGELAVQEALIRQGEMVYAANGCVYCHTQQVRSPSYGNDDKRFWGDRRSVAADYQGDQFAFLGTMRTGPDLANVGQRLSSAGWHYQHLFEPTSTTPGSIMPAHRFLFERKKVVGGVADAEAMTLDAEGNKIDADGYQWVPGEDARALIAYLLNLKRTMTPRPEAEEAPLR